MATPRFRLGNIAKSRLNGLAATIQTLSNEYVMEQLERSEADINNGRIRKAREFLKEL